MSGVLELRTVSCNGQSGPDPGTVLYGRKVPAIRPSNHEPGRAARRDSDKPSDNGVAP